MRTYEVTLTITMKLTVPDDAIERALRDEDGSWAEDHGYQFNVAGAPESRNRLYREAGVIHVLAMRVGVDEAFPPSIPGFEDLADDDVQATEMRSTSTFKRLDEGSTA